MSDRLDRIEAEIDRMLTVQRELQESQLRQESRFIQQEDRLIQQEDRLIRLSEVVEQNSEAIATLERSVSQLVNVATAQQDSMEQLKRAIDYLLSKDGINE